MKAQTYNLPKKTSKYNIALTIIEFQNSIELNLYYNSSLYHKKRIDRIHNSFINIISRVVNNADMNIENIYQKGLDKRQEEMDIC